jgi:hypothetical protein
MIMVMITEKDNNDGARESLVQDTWSNIKGFIMEYARVIWATNYNNGYCGVSFEEDTADIDFDATEGQYGTDYLYLTWKALEHEADTVATLQEQFRNYVWIEDNGYSTEIHE